MRTTPIISHKKICLSLSIWDLLSQVFRTLKGQELLILFIFSPLTLRRGTNLLDADAELEVMAHVGLGPSVSLRSLRHTTESDMQNGLDESQHLLGESPVLAKKRDGSV